MLGSGLKPGTAVLGLTLLTASLLSFGSAARADWLVTNNGAAVETRGAWEVKGETVIFTSREGVLSSLSLAEVNLAASEAHTQDMVRAAASAHEIEAPVKRPAVLVLTDADVRHVDSTGPVAEDAGETAASPSPRDTGSSLSVTGWDESYNIDENSVEVTGTLRNSGRNPATSISLSVLLYSDAGALLGKREARLAKAALNPGESTGFVASFSSGLTFSEAKFDIQSRGFQTREADQEDGDTAEEPAGM
jgi:hypothetical protein